MRKMKLFAAAFGLLFALQAFVPVYAADADVTVREYQLDENGEEILYEDPKTGVLCGDVISKIVYVCNDGDSCAEVRIKPEIEDAPAEFLAGIQGINPEWELREDGWYYYPRSLKKGERVVFAESFRIGCLPQAEWELKTFRVIFTAEAASCAKGTQKTAPATGDNAAAASACAGAAAAGAAILLAAAAGRKRERRR